MGANAMVVGFVGSPNREGRTNQLVKAALDGAARAGAPTELIQMADHVVAACKDCQPWVCLTNQKCTYEDNAFEYLSQKVLNCGALVLGTPVYWWDTSGMVKYFILKMFRVYARSAPLQGITGRWPQHCGRHGQWPCFRIATGIPLLPDHADAGDRAPSVHAIQLPGSPAAGGRTWRTARRHGSNDGLLLPAWRSACCGTIHCLTWD